MTLYSFKILNYQLIHDISSEVEYAIGERGSKICQHGSTILDQSECEVACDQLKLEKGTLRDGKPCYMAGN